MNGCSTCSSHDLCAAAIKAGSRVTFMQPTGSADVNFIKPDWLRYQHGAHRPKLYTSITGMKRVSAANSLSRILTDTMNS